MTSTVRVQVPAGAIPGTTVLQLPMDGGGMVHVQVPLGVQPGVTFLDVALPEKGARPPPPMMTAQPVMAQPVNSAGQIPMAQPVTLPTQGVGVRKAEEDDCCVAGCCFASNSVNADEQIIAQANGAIAMNVLSWVVMWGSYWAAWCYISTIFSVIICAQILQKWKRNQRFEARTWSQGLFFCGLATLLGSFLALIQAIVFSAYASQASYACYSSYYTGCYNVAGSYLAFSIPAYLAWLFMMIAGALGVDLSKKVSKRDQVLTAAGV